MWGNLEEVASGARCMAPSEKSAAGKGPSLDELAAGKRPSAIRVFFAFLSSNKKWWLLPPLVVLLVLGILLSLSSTVVAPFIYTLF
jgi:hypothetical protein